MSSRYPGLSQMQKENLDWENPAKSKVISQILLSSNPFKRIFALRYKSKYTFLKRANKP